MSADQVPAVLSPCCAKPVTSTITGRRCSHCHVLVKVVSLGGGCAVACPMDPAAFVREWNTAARNRGR